AFRSGVPLIIATPGRLNDHLDRGSARLDAVEVLVLDEADRMLDMGFKPQLDRILAHVRKPRQTLLFSATMAGEVADFAARHLRRIAAAAIWHVSKFDLPHAAEDYVHRTGRTARAEASGRASSFAAPDEHDLLHGIEKLTRKQVERAHVPRHSETFRSAVQR